MKSIGKYTYYPMHMHLHSCFQPGMSMAAHMYNAQQLGMRYIWFTDHDTATGTKRRPINGFTFDTEALTKADNGFLVAEFDTSAQFSYRVDPVEKTAMLQACADERDQWQSAGIYFMSTGHRHNTALLMDTSLKLNAEVEGLSADSRLIFDISLSQRPPNCKQSHMLYVLGNPEGLAAPDCQILPMKLENGIVYMPLYQDVSENPAIGGKDNVFDTITVTLQVRSGASLHVEISDFEIKIEKIFEQAHKAQKEEAARVGKYYGITPFVAFEYSLTEHKNCFCSSVPTIDYEKLGWKINDITIAAHTKEYGGVFAINHPLALSVLKRKEFTQEQRLQVIARSATALLSCDAYGAELIEVGYPMGRNGFSLQEYLMLWDLLSAGGLFLCGYGCSDCHRNNENWFAGNNFATWLGVNAGLEYPISEDAFMLAMRRGNAYCGDPTVIKGTVTYNTFDGFQQGTVFSTNNVSQVAIRFHAQDVKRGWHFRLIENGHEVFCEEIAKDEYVHEAVLTASRAAVSFQRAEMYDEAGRCILLTNPIYLVKPEELARKIPKHRSPEGQK